MRFRGFLKAVRFPFIISECMKWHVLYEWCVCERERESVCVCVIYGVYFISICVCGKVSLLAAGGYNIDQD